MSEDADKTPFIENNSSIILAFDRLTAYIRSIAGQVSYQQALDWIRDKVGQPKSVDSQPLANVASAAIDSHRAIKDINDPNKYNDVVADIPLVQQIGGDGTQYNYKVLIEERDSNNNTIRSTVIYVVSRSPLSAADIQKDAIDTYYNTVPTKQSIDPKYGSGWATQLKITVIAANRL